MSQPGASRVDVPADASLHTVQDIIRAITPGILEASKSVAEEISRATLAEMEAWKQLQETRRQRDAESFSFDGNREQHTHESKILTILENAELHMQNKKYAKVQEQLKQGKELVTSRLKTIKMADDTNWGTVKEYKLGTLGLGDEEDKKWNDAVKSFKSKSRRSTITKPTASPYPHEQPHPTASPFSPYYRKPTATRSSNTFQPKSRPPPTCFKCWKVGHMSFDCNFKTE